MEPIPVAPQGLTLGVGKLEQVEQMACEATESRRLLESELQGVEDEARRQKREEQAKREQVVEHAVQEMRFVCDICGNKSYKNVTDYTNHLDSYDHHHAKRMLEYKQQSKGCDADRAVEREERSKREAKEADKEIKRMQLAVAAAAAAAEKASAAKAAAAAASAAATSAPPITHSNDAASAAASTSAAPVTVKFGILGKHISLPPLLVRAPISFASVPPPPPPSLAPPCLILPLCRQQAACVCSEGASCGGQGGRQRVGFCRR